MTPKEAIQKCKEIPDDEPVFLLRGRDPLAVSCISQWACLAEQGNVNADKVGEAKACELKFGRYNLKKIPD